MAYTDQALKSIVDKIGLKSNPPFICVNPKVSIDRNGKRLIELKNCKSRETAFSRMSPVLRGSNPWSRKISAPEVERDLTKIGLKSNPAFICINGDMGYTKGERVVELQNCQTKAKIISRMSNVKNGRNPWRERKFDDTKVKKRIDKIGLKSSPPFICSNPFAGQNEYGNRLLEIQNCETFKILVRNMNYIKEGHNPWNEDQNRIELNITQPKAIKLCEKLGFIVLKQGYKLGIKAIIDLRVTHPKLNYTIGIEIKPSEIFRSYSKDQMKRYRQKSKLKQHNMKHIFFADPQGAHAKHGFISFKQLEQELKNLLKGK